MSEKTQNLNRATTSTSVFGPRSPVPSSPSARARLLTALISLPSFFTINTPIEAVPAALLLILLWLIGDRQKNIPRSAKTFIYLTPALTLINALLTHSNATPGLTLNGAVIGLTLSLRLLWTFLLISVLFRSAPLDEMMTLFRSLFRLLHLPERECSETVAITLTLLPDFTSFPVKRFRNLPEAIAERITAAENRINTAQWLSQTSSTSTSTCSFRPLDLALLLPAALFLILTIII